ncbi:hypothetical protein Tco_0772218 [Tanacetum coccineum]|uniref:Xylulose kinase-1 n=2 Tax=Tanacetum coccineum TaxID=301880 RepID=A0ABQ4ZID2_9ASTR
MVAFLEKSTGSAGFHQVIDFLNRSHICYALTKKPDVYISFIKQFWRSAEATTDDNGEVQITATIDGHSMSITEASLRRHLKLDDHDGITSIPNSEIFEQLALMGYHTDSQGCFFTSMELPIGNLSFLDMQRKQLQQHSRTYPVPSLSIKVFNNMKRPTKGYSGQEVALFPTMLDVTEPSTSPSRITSSPSHSPEHSPSHSHEPSIKHSPDHTIFFTKSKKELEQERLSFAEAIKLQEQRAQIARDEEIARQWDAEERQRATSEAKSTKEIDWNDPSVIRYHALKMKPKTVAQARRNMKSEQKEEAFQEKAQEVLLRDKRWRKMLRRKISKDNLDIVPREDVVEDVNPLIYKVSKFVDWKTCVLTKKFMYYQVFRGDGSSKNYNILSEMLEDFDRQDVMDLHRLVKERYSASRTRRIIHNHDLDLKALDSKHIGEDFIISSIDIEFKLVLRLPLSMSVPLISRTKQVCFLKATSRSESQNCPTENR